MRVIFEAHGETQINRRFLRYMLYSGDAAPAFEAIYEYLLRVEGRQFDTEGGSEPWPALAAGTVVQKARAGLRPEILRATDDLMNSLTKPDDPNQMKIITQSTLAFGSMLDYARFHQSGTSRMPQRRPINLTEENKVMILKAVQLWLGRGQVMPLGAVL